MHITYRVLLFIQIVFFSSTLKSSKDVPNELYNEFLLLNYGQAQNLLNTSAQSSNEEFNYSLFCQLMFDYGQLGNKEYFNELTELNFDIEQNQLKHLNRGYFILYHFIDKTKALEYFFKSLNLSRKLNLEKFTKLSLLAILEYYSFETFTSNNSYQIYLDEFTNLSQSPVEKAWATYYYIYFKTASNNPKDWLSKEAWSKLTELKKSIPSSPFRTVVNGIIAIQYEHAGNLANAEAIHLKVLSNADRLPHLRYLCFRTFFRLVEIEKKRKNFHAGLNYLEKSINYIDKLDSLTSRKFVYSYQADMNFALGNYEKAYLQIKKVSELDLKINIRDNLLKSTEMETKLRTAYKEKELLEKKFQNEQLNNTLSKEKIKTKQFYTTSLSLGVLLILAIGGLWVVRQISILKQKNLNQKIKDTQQKAQLQAVNAKLDGQEIERKNIASAIHDGISSHLAAASIHLSLIENKESISKSSLSKASFLISEASQRARNISHNLYPPLLKTHGLVSSIHSLADQYSNSQLKIQVKADPNFSIKKDSFKSKLYFVINECLQNVLKHSRGTKCEVHFSNLHEMSLITISDDGIGMVDNHQNSGLGIQSIISRIENIGGYVTISLNQPSGTKIELYIPNQLS